MSRYFHYETFGNKALGHVISGYLNSEKVTHIIYFWVV